MSRSNIQLFGMETVSDYLALCVEAVHDLKGQEDSVLKGFAAILALNHMADWLRYKLSESERVQLGLPNKPLDDPVASFFEKQNGDLVLVRQIANGFKHLRPVHSTQRVAGYGVGPYGIGPFGAPYLLIDLGDDKDSSERWCVGLDLCQRVLDWWQAVLMPIVKKEGS
ncbi:hypothetical protein ACFORG_14935 [Lutimaribacter marinistellae]|uniref:Uncharacterized protein n=1 Tax=Lutimaribacter marinistellae TaxID=1820329 RepID=A0ABV7THJ2_9RHOB